MKTSGNIPALKTSGVTLELLTDIDMLLMIEKGLRGGISMISNRHGKDNSPYMGSDYDEKKPTKYNTYLDANNLYGCAMIQPLPVCKFEWLENFFFFGGWKTLKTGVINLASLRLISSIRIIFTISTMIIHSLLRESWSTGLES